MATSPEPAADDTDDLRPEYDFRSLRGVARGRYAERYSEQLRVVRLDEDVASAFENEDAVNQALREFLQWQKDCQANRPA